MGYTLFESPLWTSDMSLPMVIGNQLDNVAGGDELYDYDMNKATYASGAWVGSPIQLEKARGYYLRILNTARVLTFVGQVDTAAVSLGLAGGYSMVGNPYPIVKVIEQAFQNASVGDELYDKYANKKTRTSTGWVGAVSADFEFGIGDGFWYRNLGSGVYDWQLEP
jgi:hypothetical protein